MPTIELWFAESVDHEGAFAINPARKLTPTVNATPNTMDALVFADEEAAQAWCDTHPQPRFVPSLWVYETPHIH